MRKGIIFILVLMLTVSLAFAENATNLLQYGESNVNRDGVTKENSNHFTTRDILLDQQPNQVNGLFCDASYTQVIAENFILGADMTIEGLVIWGGNYPNNIPMADDYLTVAFHTDAAGAIGTMISTEVDVPYTKSQTGVQLFGVDEWIYTLTLATPVDLTAGTYWVEFYNTTGGPYPTVDTFFWETGDVDPVNGIVGSAWATVAPGSGWNYDSGTDLSIQVLGSGGGGDYCDATTSFEDEYIGNVLCVEIDNTTGWQGGVADYTAMSATIEVGGSADILVTNGGNAYSSDAVSCFVDWNNDYVWELGGDEEFILNNDGTGAFFDGVIAVPAGTSLGLHRMRIRMVYFSVPDPCGDSTYGEVEDYTINVTAGGPVGDTCESAEVIGEVIDYPFDTSTASPSVFGGGYITSNDLWFEFTAPSDGSAYFGVCDSGFDTYIVLWGECDPATMIAENDDSCGLQSELFDIPVVSGEDYYLQVGGYSTSNGAGVLDIIFTSSGQPIIGVTPMSITEELEPDEVVVVPVTIENTGTTDLTFAITVVETSLLARVPAANHVSPIYDPANNESDPMIVELVKPNLTDDLFDL
ncbi:MAG: hypothetical protein KAS53_08920, partial [Candidatus Cloacimonetes bacterium]|nr:hypothetical protein [Candidatus Cloacimonadota bacterium]